MYRYKVLLVDDEPLVLAGIKIMADWNRLNCELTGNAKNGRQALELMGQTQPDIVIADINMPIMNGIEMLENAQEVYPETVFVMLTNMTDFDLVRECLQYQVVDYIVKTEMDQASLEETVEKAKLEADKRRKLSENDLERDCAKLNTANIISEGMIQLYTNSYLPPALLALMERQEILDSYIFLSLQFAYPAPLMFSDDAYQQYERLYTWECEIVQEISKTCFSNVLLIKPESTDHAHLILLVWGVSPDTYTQQIENFYKKLQTASQELTGLTPCLLATDAFTSKDGLKRWPAMIKTLQDHFYNTGETILHYRDLTQTDFQKLDTNSLIRGLRKDIENRNNSDIFIYLKTIMETMSGTYYRRKDCIWLCSEIYHMVCDAMTESCAPGRQIGLFSCHTPGYAYLKYILTRNDAIHFLMSLGNELFTVIQPASSHHEDIITRAKSYIKEHLHKRISLNDVAQHVYLSPGYLSALFKKQCQESLVDYINRKKMEEACLMLESETYLINQISELLSFENAYYFTRVFKKHIGVTPREYQDRCRKKRTSP